MPAQKVYLVLIENSSNQRHIFETNKLRDNVGASQQIYNLGYKVVLGAVHDAGGVDAKYPDDPDKIKDFLAKLESDENSLEKTGIEVWYVASGKAMLIVKESHINEAKEIIGHDKAKEIIARVTKEALLNYPGTQVRGVISKSFELTVGNLEDQVKNVHEKLEAKRGELPPSEGRFQRLPIIDECRVSGLPANGLASESGGGEPIPVSVIVQKKRALQPINVDTGKVDDKNTATYRMQELVDSNRQVLIARNIGQLEQWLSEHRFLAVIHADGTGMGKIFQSFSKYFQTDSPEEYIKALRRFSIGIDICTKLAFRTAIKSLAEKYRDAIDYLEKKSDGTLQWKVPILPLIVGGDDVTLMCPGSMAIPLMIEFLTQFEEQVSTHKGVHEIAKKAFGVNRLGMCAGIAFVKPHFPFYLSYQLASDLEGSAKKAIKEQLKMKNGSPWPVTAFDFHVHHSSSGDGLKKIRKELTKKSDKECERLFGSPYIVTGINQDQKGGTSQLSDEQRGWAENHSASKLKKKVRALQQTNDEGKRELPNSQLHELRSALFQGKAIADSALSQIKHRYGDTLGKLLEQDSSLFREEEGIHVTEFLDALSLAKLYPEDNAHQKNSASQEELSKKEANS